MVLLGRAFWSRGFGGVLSIRLSTSSSFALSVVVITKSKTRFAVIANGQRRELFSVRERGNGDLIIFPRHSTDYGSAPNKLRRYAFERYSIHRSPASELGGHTVKQTIGFQDGGSLENVQFRLRSQDRFCALVYGKACQRLGVQKYLLKERVKDKVVLLDDADYELLSPFYFLIVTDKKARSSQFRVAGLKSTKVDFKYFRLHVLSGVFLVPRLELGYSVYQWTSLPRIDGKDAPIELRTEIGALSAAKLGKAIPNYIAVLANGLSEAHKNHVFPDRKPMTPDMIEMAAPGFTIYLSSPNALGSSQQAQAVPRLKFPTEQSASLFQLSLGDIERWISPPD